MKKKCTDHLGNEFNSVKEMCKYWNISYNAYLSRRKYNISIKDALTIPIKETHGKQCEDHMGNKFKSEKEMCNYYNILYKTYKKRIILSWTLKETLTTPIKEKCKQCTDHLGNKFKSIEKMCQYWNISSDVYNNRQKLKWSLKRILTTPVYKGKKCIDYLGNEFNSEKEMCEYYNLPYTTYKQRKHNGWSLKDIFTIPIKETHGKQCEDHLGNKFDSIIEMCKYWNIHIDTYKGRIKRDWSIEEALTIPTNMYIGEYRVKQSLEKYNISYIHNKTIKTIFKKFEFDIDWNEFLSQLQVNLTANNINWSKTKIERLKPDFVLYRDKDNKITGVIEFDGEQHQNFIEYFFKTIEDFLKRSDVDFVKNSLWEYLNIPMLRIRHDQVDLIDNMVLDFINNPQKYIKNHNTYLTEEEYWEGLKETLEKFNDDNLGCVF